MPKNLGKSEEPLNNGIHSSEDRVHSCRLRGLRWRIMLDVLPPYPATVEELRRAAADGRRRYAELRRRLLVDPHTMEELRKPSQLSMDNPLSQDPESIWGRYFHNAELEITIDKDLTRLYQEHGSFFQSPTCQAMLRRILLVWSLIHPHYSYRQGMHELLAPLLFVLHNDVLHLSELEKRYKDIFNDRFDNPYIKGGSIHERVDIQKETGFCSDKALPVSEGTKTDSNIQWVNEHDEFCFDLKIMVDTYGPEGELGVLLSSRFIEHDAYCMYDALMSGQGGAVALAEYFTTMNGVSTGTGLPLVLEASASLYRALSAADFSLYNHLVGLGIEPQFFALRWFRVLFGREFNLQNLLLLWDAIFAVSNTPLPFLENDDSGYDFKYSSRSAFILAVAISMLLYLRETLLTALDAGWCLQKLLNFPQTVDIKHLIDKAKTFQSLADDAINSVTSHGAQFIDKFKQAKSMKLLWGRHGSLPVQGYFAPSKDKASHHQNFWSPEMLRQSLVESYWEMKWKNSVLRKVVPEDSLDLSNTHGCAMAKHIDEKPAFCLPQQQHIPPAVSSAERNVNKERVKLPLDTLHGVHAGSVEHIKYSFDNELVNKTTLGDLPLNRPSDMKARFHKNNLVGVSPITAAGCHGNLPCLDRISSVVEEGLNPGVKEEQNTIELEGGGGKEGDADVHGSDGGPLQVASLNSNSKAVLENDKESLKGPSTLQKLAPSSTVSAERRFSSIWRFFRGKPRVSGCPPKSIVSTSISGTLVTSDAVEGCNMSRNTSEIASSTEALGQYPGNEMLSGETISDINNARTDSNQETCKSDEIHDALIGIDSKEDPDELISDRCNFSQALREKSSASALRPLGQSMLDSIQVLETVLSQRISISSIGGLLGTSVVSQDKSEHISKAFGSVKGSQVSALAALAELRKISGVLLQM
eukprot:c27876_g1_i1 orf=424-3201(-)